MRILILVLSYTESPYSDLMLAQKETWDSIDVEGVKTVFYYGGGRGWVNEKEFSGQGTDSYYYMHDKFLDALVATKQIDYDFVFRTNSSSYVNKQKLKEFAATLPTEKLYAGWTMTDSNGDGGLMVSGAGIWLSRDCVEILIHNIDPLVEKEEDVVIGRILRLHGIVAIDDRSRQDVPSYFTSFDVSAYHLRFKGKNNYRLHDAHNMRLVHEKIMNHEWFPQQY